MKLLISWSKPRSHAVADALHNWLPTVLPGIDPWISDKDIGKGREWWEELNKMLAKTRFCLICVTPENVHSPWIYYEVGMIASKHDDVRIYPYLVGVDPEELGDGPLTMWQCTTPDREDTWLLIQALNKDILNSRHSLSELKEAYNRAWPDFGEKVISLAAEAVGEKERKETAIDPEVPAWTTLSEEATTMLVAVSKDGQGTLIDASDMSGTKFQTAGKNLCPDQSARTIARWRDALRQLDSNELIEETEEDVFHITAKGFEYADKIEKAAARRPPAGSNTEATDELQSKTVQAIASSPPDAELLAKVLTQLDDVTDINFTARVASKGPEWNESTQTLPCKITWKDIFCAIGPFLINSRREHQLQDSFQDIATRWAHKYLCSHIHDPTGERIRSIDIHAENLLKILVQFRRFRLIETFEVSAANKAPVGYWKLTLFGDGVLSELS